MSSLTFFFIFVCIIAVLFLIINLVLAPRNPYSEKISAFECGFHSYLQTRQQFDISFFIYALLFLIFDLEILLIYPYVVIAYVNSIYGLVIVLIFTITLTLGFVFEIGRGALQINSKQNLQNKLPINTISFIGGSFDQRRNYSDGSSSNSSVKVYDDVLNNKTKNF